jgi:CRP/FNR family transcriptional regulator, anaerobic regulatory protein
MSADITRINTTINRTASSDSSWAAEAERPPSGSPQSGNAVRVAGILSLIANSMPIRRRVLAVGDHVYSAGENLVHLYVLNAGAVKVVNTSADGRGQIVSLNFRGDWLGFDGVATRRYACDVVALDAGEVWTLCYDELLDACAGSPSLLAVVHAEMSRSLTRSLDSMLSQRTLSVVSRVATFLRNWTLSQAERGQRCDQIALRMTRAEIGDFLGMTLESVSRGLSALARNKVIEFDKKGRRDILILDLPTLTDFICGKFDRAMTAARVTAEGSKAMQPVSALSCERPFHAPSRVAPRRAAANAPRDR